MQRANDHHTAPGPFGPDDFELTRLLRGIVKSLKSHENTWFFACEPALGQADDHVKGHQKSSATPPADLRLASRMTTR
jgi:hypothetical protein